MFDSGTGIERVPAEGGAAAKVTTLAPGEGAHTLPTFLPDGRRFFYTLGFKEPRGIYIQSLDSDRRTQVSPAAGLAAYASGYLLLNQFDGTLTAQRFDLERLEARGDPVRLADDAAGFYQTPAVGAASESLLLDSLRFAFASDWSADGKTVFVTYVPPTANQIDIAAVEVDSGSITPVVSTEFNEGGARLSPNGDAIAYTSDESGRVEVYAQLYRSAGAPTRISTAGGVAPRWSHDGRELFYLTGDGTLMTAAVAADDHRLAAETPRALFNADFALGDHSSSISELFHVPYDVSADGERFLVNERKGSVSADAEPARAGVIAVVVDWTAHLQNAQ